MNNKYPRLLTICTVLVCVFATAAWSDWHAETIDSADDVGAYNSMAIDSNGRTHISYIDYSGYLKYASQNASGWTIETVDGSGDVSSETSLALDTHGYPHIAYYTHNNMWLRYASWNGSQWSIQYVDASNATKGSVSLALDRNNNPQIAYADLSTHDLKCAVWKINHWEITDVDTAGTVGMEASLALDSQGNPHIAYRGMPAFYSSVLKYAYWSVAQSQWEISEVDTQGDTGYYPSLKLDSDDSPCIAYFEFTIGSQKLKYISYNGTNWSQEVIFTRATDRTTYVIPSLQLMDDAHPRIAFVNTNDNKLYYTQKNGTTWSAPENLSSISGGCRSLAINSQGEPRICYYDIIDGDLEYLWWQVVDTTPPQKMSPPAIAMRGTDYRSITISWSEAVDPESDIIGYKLLLGTRANPSKYLAKSLGKVLKYDVLLPEDADVVAQIAAVNSFNLQSDYSDPSDTYHARKSTDPTDPSDPNDPGDPTGPHAGSEMAEGTIVVQGGAEGFVNISKGESATILFHAPQSGIVTFKIFTLNGQFIAEISKQADGSPDSVRWDGKNDGGDSISSGIYLCYIHGAGLKAVKKIPVIR